MSARAQFFPGILASAGLRGRAGLPPRAAPAAQHRPPSGGIVAGLDLGTDEEGNLAVQAGVAFDGFGRELSLPSARGWAGNLSTTARPTSSTSTSTMAGSAARACRPGSAAATTTAVSTAGRSSRSSRSRNRRRPRWTDADPMACSSPTPTFRPSGTPPDEPERRWPVFLGTVTLDRADDRRPFAVDPAGRPYAGLVGQSVHAASGSTTVQIGAGAPGDPYRFAVHVPEAETAATANKPRLALTHDQKVEVRGDTTLEGTSPSRGDRAHGRGRCRRRTRRCRRSTGWAPTCASRWTPRAPTSSSSGPGRPTTTSSGPA